jgi:hypothetical protein
LEIRKREAKVIFMERQKEELDEMISSKENNQPADSLAEQSE